MVDQLDDSCYVVVGALGRGKKTKQKNKKRAQTLLTLVCTICINAGGHSVFTVCRDKLRFGRVCSGLFFWRLNTLVNNLRAAAQTLQITFDSRASVWMPAEQIPPFQAFHQTPLLLSPAPSLQR